MNKFTRVEVVWEDDGNEVSSVGYLIIDDSLIVVLCSRIIGTDNAKRFQIITKGDVKRITPLFPASG